MDISLNIFPLEMQIPLLVLAAVLGAVFGSFLNCAAWRLVNGESVLSGRSHCTDCGHALGVLDLVPVFSWLFLGGKCRHCGSKISPRYLLVELACAAIFVALVFVKGIGLTWLTLAVVSLLLMTLSLVDLDSFTIPNGLVIAIAVVWVANIAANAALGEAWLSLVTQGLLGASIGLFVLVIVLVFEKVTGKSGMGGGDIKLFLAVGLFLGLPKSLFNLILSCVCGLVLAVVLASKKEDAGNESAGVSPKALPFGPAISLATFITFLVGDTAVGWYLSLFGF